MYDYDSFRQMEDMSQMYMNGMPQYMPGVMQPQQSMPGMMQPQAAMPGMMEPQMYMNGMPQQYYPMLYMPEQQLNMMYPKVYHMVHGAVKHHCDMMDMKYGPMYAPTKDELEGMTENVYSEVAPKVEKMKEYKEAEEEEERQLGFGGRRILKDLILILFLRELGRRRRPHGGMFGGYGY